MRYTGRNGWRASYKDTYSLDDTLSPIILAGLERFYSVMCDPSKEDWVGVPSILRTDKDIEEDYIEWKRIVLTMVEGFRLLSENKYELQRTKEEADKIRWGLHYFGKYYECLWW